MYNKMFFFKSTLWAIESQEKEKKTWVEALNKVENELIAKLMQKVIKQLSKEILYIKKKGEIQGEIQSEEKKITEWTKWRNTIDCKKSNADEVVKSHD